MPISIKSLIKRTGGYNLNSCELYVITLQLLDGSVLQCTLKLQNTGADCMNYIRQKLQLKQNAYFGLRYKSTQTVHRWIDLKKPLKKQLMKNACEFKLYFGVMFYTAIPDLIEDSAERYYYYLQMRTDILNGRLLGTPEKAILCASYSLQAEFGDYNPDKQPDDALKNFTLLPRHMTKSAQILEGIIKQALIGHEHLIGMSQAESELAYIKEARNFGGYGDEYFSGRDEDGAEVFVGYSLGGIIVKRGIHSSPVVYGWKEVKRILAKNRNLCLDCTEISRIAFKLEDSNTAKYAAFLLNCQLDFYRKFDNHSSLSNAGISSQSCQLEPRNALSAARNLTRSRIDYRYLLPSDVPTLYPCGQINERPTASAFSLMDSDQIGSFTRTSRCQPPCGAHHHSHRAWSTSNLAFTSPFAVNNLQPVGFASQTPPSRLKSVGFAQHSPATQLKPLGFVLQNFSSSDLDRAPPPYRPAPDYDSVVRAMGGQHSTSVSFDHTPHAESASEFSYTKKCSTSVSNIHLLNYQPQTQSSASDFNLTQTNLLPAYSSPKNACDAQGSRDSCLNVFAKDADSFKQEFLSIQPFQMNEQVTNDVIQNVKVGNCDEFRFVISSAPVISPEQCQTFWCSAYGSGCHIIVKLGSNYLRLPDNGSFHYKEDEEIFVSLRDTVQGSHFVTSILEFNAKSLKPQPRRTIYHLCYIVDEKHSVSSFLGFIDEVNSLQRLISNGIEFKDPSAGSDAQIFKKSWENLNACPSLSLHQPPIFIDDSAGKFAGLFLLTTYVIKLYDHNEALCFPEALAVLRCKTRSNLVHDFEQYKFCRLCFAMYCKNARLI